jgi:hypothetical protein
MAHGARPAPRTVLEALIRHRNWSRQDFCDAFTRTAGQLGLDASVSPQHAGRWVAGRLKGMPYPAQARVLEHMFNVEAERLLASADHDPNRGPAAALSPMRWPIDPDQEITMAAEESARFAEFAEQTNIGPHTLEQFTADIKRIVTVYPNRPVYPLFVELRSLRDRAFQKLEGRQFPDQSRDLYLVAGVVGGMLANASFDLGRFDAAETQARTAFLCAELAGSNWLRAWIRGTQALIAYWEERPMAAVRLAEDGRRYTPESGTALVRLVSIQARAHGMLRDAKGVDAALGTAEAARGAVEADDDPGGMMAFPIAKQHMYASTARLWLGAADAARQAEGDASKAVRSYKADEREHRRLGELSLARLDVAAALLATNQVDGLLPEVRAVLRTAEDRPTDSVTRRLRQLDAALSRPRYGDNAVVQSLRDEMRSAIGLGARPAVSG